MSETTESPKDLRKELIENLADIFSMNICDDGTIPNEAGEALSRLVSEGDTNVESILEALSLEDSIELEDTDE